MTGVHRGLALSPGFAKSTQPDLLFLGNLRLQQALLDLGGFYVKTGQVLLDAFLTLPVGLEIFEMQVLSTRVDLFSKPFGAYVRDNQITDFGGIKQYTCMVKLRDFPYISASFGYVGFSYIAFAMNIDMIGLLSLSVA